jgi:hypothetical protein
MTTAERRKSSRVETNVLTSLRDLEDGTVKWSGFARSVNLSTEGVLIESPDPFRVEQVLTLELLLNDDQVVPVRGVVTRVTKSKGINHVAVQFTELSPRAKHLITNQVKV